MKIHFYLYCISIFFFAGCGQSASTNNTKSESTSIVKTTNKNPVDTFATIRKVLKSGIPKTKKQCYVLSESAVKYFLSEGKSIIDFYKFIRALQQYENETATVFILSDSSVLNEEYKGWVSDLILKEKALKQKLVKFPFDSKYEEQRNNFSKFLTSSINNNECLKKYGVESKEFNTSNNYSHAQFSKFINPFIKSFGMQEFISIDSATEMKLYKDACLRDYSNKNEIDTLLKHNHPYASLLLLSKIEAEDSFLYDDLNMQSADIMENLNYYQELSRYLKLPPFPDNDPTSLGFFFYEDLVNSNRYSPYLYSIWRKWRSTNQFLNHGASNLSEMPNDIYDEQRFRLMEIILHHVKENPKDTWAVLQFFYIAESDILTRNSGNPYGNSSLDERMELF